MLRGLLAGERPGNLGAHDGRLRPCPGKPNCVCSQDSNPRHAIEPLRFTGAPEAALARLVAVLGTDSAASIVEHRRDYVRAEFTSSALGFVDDVEFYIPPGTAAIEVRSASRLGYGDMGANRRRIESIRRAFASYSGRHIATPGP